MDAAFLRRLEAGICRYASRAKNIGPRIALERRRMGWTQRRLREELNDRLYAIDPKLARWRNDSSFSRVETGSPNAVQLTDTEISLLAEILLTSSTQLVGLEHQEKIVHWNLLSDPHSGTEFHRHLRCVQEGASELIGWAEYLPSSLTTEEFMRGYHAALFRPRIGGLSQECLDIGLRNYNEIGSSRRAQLLDQRASRSWRFVHIMFDDDLRAIAEGKGPYAEIAPAVRYRCLSHLRRLVEDADQAIDLVILRSNRHLSLELRFADSLVCVDDRFVFWHDHQGGVCSSVDPAIVGVRRQLVERLRARAFTATRADATAFLRGLESLTLGDPADWRATRPSDRRRHSQLRLPSFG